MLGEETTMEPGSTLQERRQHFDTRTQCYVDHGYDRVEAARFVASVLDPSRDGTVLDVGTGRGLLAVALASRGTSVVTVDPDPADQELAALLAREAGVDARLKIITADAASLPYPDGYFSAAASMDVLHHLADAEPVLKEVVRVLSPHGELLLADFSREGFDMVTRVHQEEGRVHSESGVTIDHAAALLQQWGFCTVVRFTRQLHDIAVFTRHNHALGQDTLQDTCRTAHPHCLVCGADNPHGLHLEFAVQPDRSVHATFRGGAAYQGYPDAIHGGLLATLLDAAMTNCLFSRGISAVTARLNVRYASPARWYRPCEIAAWLERTARDVRYLSAEVRQDGRVVARASGTFIGRHPKPPSDERSSASADRNERT
jgi:ubiquinone/menaquinone biosynthesis C-methylase UbiE/acyl-coenzyme A thioesterase PaaI-like protein